MNHPRQVVISGIGVVSPLGLGIGPFWEGLTQGRSAARLITSFDASGMPTRFWADVPADDTALVEHLTHKKSGKLLTRSAKMAMIAAAEAVGQSGLDFSTLPPARSGISVGVSGLGLNDPDMAAISFRQPGWLATSDLPYDNEAEFWAGLVANTNPLFAVKAIPNAVAAHLSILYQIQGSSTSITTACTSSSQAIGEAFHKIKYGLADAMLAGGADSMTNPSSLLSFSLLGVLSRNNTDHVSASRPFDRDRDGFVLGEGAAFFVLETLDHCRRRGGQPLAEICGFGTTSDAFRITDEPDDARGSIAAMRLALEEAELAPEQVGYINAHGTSTRMNDYIETRAIKQVFGSSAYRVPISSNKSMFGHLVAAAGAIELAASVLTLQHQVIPPTINLKKPDPECDLDYVPGEAREVPVHTVLSNSFGFGGQNSCLVIKHL